MEFYLGQILLLPYNFAPRNTLPCDGRLMSIVQNTALFSLLGTTYGGDGITTFALPDLRSCTPIGVGQKPGYSQIQLGEAAGFEQVTLTNANLPMHNHVLGGNSPVSIAPHASAQAGTVTDPTNAVWANSGDSLAPTPNFQPATPGQDIAMAPITGTVQLSGTTGIAGGSSPVGIRNPYLGLQYVITTEGIYPSHP
jgi:microcystin-dependent protein